MRNVQTRFGYAIMTSINYIAFEGIDGSGKTTQVIFLCDMLPKHYITPVRLSEPTYGEYGTKVRKHIRKGDQISVETQRELFTHDRREHVRWKINPLLQFVRKNDSFLIIQDRCYLSAPAYQADTEADMIVLLQEQQAFAPKPDIIFLLDLPARVAAERLAERGIGKGLFEKPDFLERARERYLFLANEGSERVEVLDSTEPTEQISEKVLSVLNLKALNIRERSQA